MTAARVTPSWLALREPADAAARARDLVDELRGDLSADRPLVVHDLGCGTGSMLRWLAPQLPTPQRWVCHDLDADLLALVARGPDRAAGTSAAVSVAVRQQDVTRLEPGECADAAVVTTSALLDLLTAEELGRVVAACVQPGCPVLLSLSVTGRVELSPAHPLDAAVADAFNAHQRRITDRGRLLGPDGVDAAVRALRDAGYQVLTRASDWRLGAAETELTAAWFTGWLAAAGEQRPELAPELREYRRQRLADAAAGRLRVVVGHRDLLGRPSGGRAG